MTTARTPYVCIGDSILDEPWPFEVKAALVFLSAHMHVRWRSNRRLTLQDVAASHPVSMPDLMKITGKGRRDIALKSARSLAEVASMSIELRGDILWIKWPKWAEFNSMHSRSPVTHEPLRDPRPSTLDPSKKEDPPAPHEKPASAGKNGSPKPDTIPEVWPQIRRAFLLYGVRLREKPQSYAKAIRERLNAGASAEDVVNAVHGYAARHQNWKPGGRGDFVPRAHFTPRAIYRASNFDEYLRVFDARVGQGVSPPYMAGWMREADA